VIDGKKPGSHGSACDNADGLRATPPGSLCDFPALERAENATGGFCVRKNHGISWPYALAVWRIDKKLYCDDCARKLK